MMARKVKAMIFEWAGTVIDYGCFASVQAFMETFKEAGADFEIDSIYELPQIIDAVGC